MCPRHLIRSWKPHHRQDVGMGWWMAKWVNLGLTPHSGPAECGGGGYLRCSYWNLIECSAAVELWTTENEDD